ncbi:MAG: hypothetical protein P8X68_02000 [Desulfobacterales bacterium]
MLKTVARKIAVRCFIGLFFLMILRPGDLFGESQNSGPVLSLRIVLTQNGCQLAIWLNDESGKFIDTIYVTRKTARKGLGNRGGGLDDRLGGSRLSVLPVWAHQRGIKNDAANFYPSKTTPLVDAISSATPKAGQFIWNWKPRRALKLGRYDYYIEVNKSFDQNEYHNYSWYRGQPSVIWRGHLQIGDQISRSKAEIIGHGDVAGADGRIDADLSTLTTALDLIREAEAVYRP